MSRPGQPAEQATSAHIAASSSLAILNTGRIQSCAVLYHPTYKAIDKASFPPIRLSRRSRARPLFLGHLYLSSGMSKSDPKTETACRRLSFGVEIGLYLRGVCFQRSRWFVSASGGSMYVIPLCSFRIGRSGERGLTRRQFPEARE
jgi:hypothetical protein